MRETKTAAVTEADLQSAVLEAAAILGWTAIHHRPGRTRDSWRTAAQGNGAKGFPDTVLARDGWLVFAELKDRRGSLSAAQELWRDLLEEAADRNPLVLYRLWRPADWLDGTVERTLRWPGGG